VIDVGDNGEISQPILVHRGIVAEVRIVRRGGEYGRLTR
jgi:hypothetical protein